MIDKLYPLKFRPIFKEKLWGGDKLNRVLNKNIEGNKIGESWEISDVEGDNSIVDKGKLAGQSLSELIREYKEDLVGEKVYAAFKHKFPLLVKFIDANKDLSIQLHPNDTLAAERHNSFGKTEMWYVMQADDKSELIVGFDGNVTKQDYLHHLDNNSLSQILNKDKVTAGDTYFIEVGRVHAIGAGVLLAEIQQTSDITYRLYDWDRKDADGNVRELHTELALDAIDFDMDDNFRVHYRREKNKVNDMVKCQYFTTNFLDVSHSIQIKNKEDSFHIYLCVEGAAEFIANDFNIKLNKGETLLMPAIIKEFKISSISGKLLQVYI